MKHIGSVSERYRPYNVEVAEVVGGEGKYYLFQIKNSGSVLKCMMNDCFGDKQLF